MPFLVAMPARVMKPTIEATDRLVPADPHRRDAADQREGDVGHDDRREDHRLVARVEHQEHERERDERERR
jgi:hypothetical protein